MCAMGYTFCQQSKRKLIHKLQKRWFRVSQTCQQTLHCGDIQFDSRKAAQRWTQAPAQLLDLLQREARGIHHPQSARDLCEGMVPLAPARRRGCSGPAGQGLQLTRGHRRGPRSYSPLPGLQTALQRCPASQRNKCLHYLLVNNFPFGFCF